MFDFKLVPPRLTLLVPLVIPWLPPGYLWLPLGYPLVTHWLPPGYPLVIPWLPFGYPLVTLWLPPGYPLVTPWLTRQRLTRKSRLQG